MRPYFSIIVVSYNAGELIKKTVDSVLAQTFDDFEIIVKDAISKDDTLNFVPQNDKIKVYVEKDKGIYDGMNVAVKKATGKYLCFLNCGDFFADNTVLQQVYEISKDVGEESVVYGNYVKKGIECRQITKLNKFNFYRNTICHQSVFFGNCLFEKYGLYNTDYTICADYDFILRTWSKGVPYVYIDTPICDYQGDGVSESKAGLKKQKKQLKSIRKTYFNCFQRFLFFTYLVVTLAPLRTKLLSNDGPTWFKRFYRKIVNKLNK